MDMIRLLGARSGNAGGCRCWKARKMSALINVSCNSRIAGIEAYRPIAFASPGILTVCNPPF